MELQEFAVEVAALTRPSQFHDLLTHLFAKESYDGNTIIIELTYAVGLRSVFLKNLVPAVILDLRGDLHCGPPPPSKEEREFRPRSRI